MLPPCSLGQALCMEAGTSQGQRRCPWPGGGAMQSPRGGARPKNRETTQGSRGLCKLSSLMRRGGVPILFEVCPLGASGPSKLTSQFRFWSLLLIHVESLPNLGQRRSGNVRRQNVSPSRSGSWESLCRG